jgi:hypothetical protein
LSPFHAVNEPYDDRYGYGGKYSLEPLEAIISFLLLVPRRQLMCFGPKFLPSIDARPDHDALEYEDTDPYGYGGKNFSRGSREARLHVV